MWEVAKWLKTTNRAAEPILRAMVHAGILVGHGGRYQSGYDLGSPPKSITVKRIVDALADFTDPTSPSEFCGGTPLGNGVVKPYIDDLMDRWMNDLRDKTIADFVEDAFRAGIITVSF